MFKRQHRRSSRPSDICHSMTSSTLQILVVSLVLNKLDFDNALLVGLPNYLIHRFQAVQNASARLIHPLPVTVSTLWFHCSGSVSRNALLSWLTGATLPWITHPRHCFARSSPTQTVFTFHLSGRPWSTPKLSQLPDLASGTIYLRTLHLLKHYTHYVTGLSRTCFSTYLLLWRRPTPDAPHPRFQKM